MLQVQSLSIKISSLVSVQMLLSIQMLAVLHPTHHSEKHQRLQLLTLQLHHTQWFKKHMPMLQQPNNLWLKNHHKLSSKK